MEGAWPGLSTRPVRPRRYIGSPTRFPSHYTREGWSPRRRLSCRALPPPPVALLVTARLTAAKSERHCWVNLAVGVLPMRSNGPFPKQPEEWHLKHTQVSPLGAVASQQAHDHAVSCPDG